MSNKKSINLALQGGGAHGAFTWGVLDAFLEDNRIDIEGITATSAGAMNAAVLAQGKALGGDEKARETLHDFWWTISRAGSIFSPVKRTPLEMMMALNPVMESWALDQSLSFAAFDALSRTVSPYEFNPFDINPLRTIVEEAVDFETVHACDCLKLFISATNVKTNTAKIFRNKEVTTDVLMASAALPFLFQAVEIDGEHYWDGGYMGNPSLYPLFYETESRDIMIVHINPITRGEVPKKAYDIQNRLNEITFNASLLKELRAIMFVKRLIEDDMLKDEYKNHYKDVLLHAIRTDNLMCDLSVASKFDTSWPFMKYLHNLGYTETKDWLSQNFDAIGNKTTVDIEEDYLLKSSRSLNKDRKQPQAHKKKAG